MRRGGGPRPRTEAGAVRALAEQREWPDGERNRRAIAPSLLLHTTTNLDSRNAAPREQTALPAQACASLNRCVTLNTPMVGCR